MRKLVIKVLAAAFALSLLCACGTPKAPAEPLNTLVYGSGDYTSINPALYEHGEINSLLFSGLTAHDAQNKVIPALAERWEFDEAARTYTFHLRTDVKWHDGQPFTAADVKFTLEAIRNPANASEIASNYEDVTAVETPDPATVKISLKAPNVAMLDYLTIGILPKHLLEGRDLITDPFNQSPIGTGPFRFAAWDAGQSITLEKNADYFGGAPALDRVIFKIVVDEKARAMQLKSGELGMAQITPRDAQTFRATDGFTVYSMKTADYRGILYNFKNPLFAAHRELPAALGYAIDRASIVSGVLLGHGQAAYSPLQAGPYCNEAIERFDYNPAKTRALLEAAGWAAGADGVYEKDGTRLAFEITCAEGDQVRVDIANVCAQQLRAVGAEVRVGVSSEIDWAGQQAYLIGWGSPFDPDDHTYKVFGTGKAANYGSYSNADVDALLQKARETDADAERMTYYKEFQTALAADPPFTFLVYADALYVAKSGITGITADTVLGHHGVGIFWNIADWEYDHAA